jgi:hypothetical protein
MGPNPGRGVSGNMRRLHLVGYSADHGGFVLAARRGARTGSYVLAVDAALLDELDRVRRAGGAPPEPAPAAPSRSGVQSSLTPKEIQARLRAGQTMDEVAAEAGVGVDWIERFAAPVLAEQAAAVQRAAGAFLRGDSRRGPSERPLEAALRRNLADRGLLMTEQDFVSAWSARHIIDGDWSVAFRFRGRGRDQVAEWTLDAATGAVSAGNRLGAELGYAGPDHPDGPGDSTEAPARPTRRRPVCPPVDPLDESQPELPLSGAGADPSEVRGRPPSRRQNGSGPLPHPTGAKGADPADPGPG